jgi:hypothetical protein
MGACGTGCLITNAWIKQTKENLVYVEAEAHPNVITSPRQAFLFVQWYSLANGTVTRGAGFQTPIAAKSFLIVDAIGDRLLLRTQDGTPLVFDVAAEQYLSTTISSATLQRPLAQGTVVESGELSFSQPGFYGWNRWSGPFNSRQLTIYAGSQNPIQGYANEPGRIGVVDSAGSTGASAPQFYDVPNFRHAARVFDIQGNLVAFVGFGGELAVFNLQTRQFVPADDPSTKVFYAPDPLASLPTPLPPTPPGTL